MILRPVWDHNITKKVLNKNQPLRQDYAWKVDPIHIHIFLHQASYLVTFLYYDDYESFRKHLNKLSVIFIAVFTQCELITLAPGTDDENIIKIHHKNKTDSPKLCSVNCSKLTPVLRLPARTNKKTDRFTRILNDRSKTALQTYKMIQRGSPQRC